MILAVCGDRAVHRSRIEERHAAGLKAIDWSGVERQMSYYEPHDGDALRLDAMDSLVDNISAAVSFVRDRARGSD